jgi:hypothetical protein
MEKKFLVKNLFFLRMQKLLEKKALVITEKMLIAHGAIVPVVLLLFFESR